MVPVWIANKGSFGRKKGDEFFSRIWLKGEDFFQLKRGANTFFHANFSQTRPRYPVKFGRSLSTTPSRLKSLSYAIFSISLSNSNFSAQNIFRSSHHIYCCLTTVWRDIFYPDQWNLVPDQELETPDPFLICDFSPSFLSGSKYKVS